MYTMCSTCTFDAEFRDRVLSDFNSLFYSVLKSNHPEVLPEYLEGSSPPDTVAIPTLLLRLARLDALSPQSSHFSANLLECVLILVSRGTDDMVTSTGWSLLTQLVQVIVGGNVG